MTLTTGNTELDRAILAIIGSLVTARVIRFLTPKSKIKYYIPDIHRFTIPSDPPQNSFPLFTATLRVINVGKEKASNVEVYHNGRPQNFQVYPALAYEEVTNPQGEHIIRIKTLAPKEEFTIEMLSAHALPQFMRVRSDEGAAETANMTMQPVHPRWLNLFAGLLMLTGLSTCFYFVIKFVG